MYHGHGYKRGIDDEIRPHFRADRVVIPTDTVFTIAMNLGVVLQPQIVLLPHELEDLFRARKVPVRFVEFADLSHVGNDIAAVRVEILRVKDLMVDFRFIHDLF